MSADKNVQILGRLKLANPVNCPDANTYLVSGDGYKMEKRGAEIRISNRRLPVPVYTSIMNAVEWVLESDLQKKEDKKEDADE